MAAVPQRNAAYAVIAVVGLLTAGVLLYNYATTPADRSPIPQSYSLQAVCLACTKETNLTRGLLAVPPFECPSCGKKAVFGWQYCASCAKRFVPQPEAAEGEAPHLPVRLTCPNCGSEAVGALTAADPTQKPTGDLPLPKWPPIPMASPSTMPASAATTQKADAGGE
ncbi:MAG: hypothetical protein U1D55_06835 [Phycisphaerae bacterium]